MTLPTLEDIEVRTTRERAYHNGPFFLETRVPGGRWISVAPWNLRDALAAMTCAQCAVVRAGYCCH